jgi:hypothetical protein
MLPLRDGRLKMLTILCTILALFIFRVTGYAVTGISAGVNSITGERPFRQEINVFAASGAAWDLYILSLRRLQQTNQNDSLSYFQIAGNSSRLAARCATPDSVELMQSMCYRNPWIPAHPMGRSQWHLWHAWVLYACCCSIPDLAPPVSGAF